MTAPATLAEVPVYWQLGMQAAASLAALNLKRTEVRATVNGFVSNLNLARGDYASPAKPVLALIDSDSYRVDAYFEETKIPQIRVGSPVDIHLMNGAAVLRGCVESIARGITDQDNRDGPSWSPASIPHLGEIGAADSGPHPPDRRPSGGAGQRWYGLHGGLKGWGGAAHRRGRQATDCGNLLTARFGVSQARANTPSSIYEAFAQICGS
jgi:hypothetical protein